MSKKILNVATFGLLGKSSSKKAETPAATATAEQKGPIIKQLGAVAAAATPGKRRKAPWQSETILSDKLG